MFLALRDDRGLTGQATHDAWVYATTNGTRYVSDSLEYRGCHDQLMAKYADDPTLQQITQAQRARLASAIDGHQLSNHPPLDKGSGLVNLLVK
jgi:hypothetical protein